VQASVHAPAHLELGDETVRFIARLTYDAKLSNGKLALRPITFHADRFGQASSLLRRSNGSTAWVRGGPLHGWEELGYVMDGCCGFMLVDCPPIQVRVNDDGGFLDLAPGQTWEVEHTITDLADGIKEEQSGPLQAGDELMFRFPPVQIEWWDWGSKAHEHADTRVYVPFGGSGPVQYPPPGDPKNAWGYWKETDNDGRPKLQVAEAEVYIRVVQATSDATTEFARL
jgi:hypothetical protein